MRYVAGTDLHALIRRQGALDASRAVDLLAELADALDAAHARGLVHRDVKPSNVLVAVEGAGEHVYLTDFGLTRQAATRGLTPSGQLAGTVDYVAPEQIRGDVVDARADVYSLGCVLFECLTGEVPFGRRSEVSAIYAHLEEDPPRASDRRPGLPAALDAVLLRAPAKDPGGRWATAGELARAARAAIAAPATSAASRVATRVVPIALALVAAAALTVGALVGGSPGGELGVPQSGADEIAVIDPHTGARRADVPVAASASDIASGAGAVWVASADSRSVSRIATATHTVTRTIRTGAGPSSLAVGLGSVWVVNSLDGTVSKIAAASGDVVKTIRVGNAPSAICVGNGAVWVAEVGDRAITRIDPRSSRTRMFPLDSAPTDLACTGGAVWASSEASGTVTQVSAATGAVVRTIDSGAGASGLLFAGSALWVANTLDGTVAKIDPDRGAVVTTVPLGPADGPSHLAAGAGRVWVTNEFAGTVVGIDPRSGTLVKKLKAGYRPQGLALVDGALWVGVRASGARHRGGTLRVVTNQRFAAEHFDPGSFITFPWKILSLTNDGLTAFRRTGGPDGDRIVADLARFVPRPGDAGRTYVFQLRRGIRYSDGELVVPSDIRTFASGPARRSQTGASTRSRFVSASRPEPARAPSNAAGRTTSPARRS